MKIKTELAGTKDLEAMTDLLSELFMLESDFSPDRAKQRRGLRLILDDPLVGQLFVARVGEQVVGMANALITVSTAEGCKVVLLEDVIVKAGFRGQKIGRRLIDYILDWTITNGMPRLTLLADKDNAEALGFYERLGFKSSAMRVLRKETRCPSRLGQAVVLADSE